VTAGRASRTSLGAAAAAPRAADAPGGDFAIPAPLSLGARLARFAAQRAEAAAAAVAASAAATARRWSAPPLAPALGASGSPLNDSLDFTQVPALTQIAAG
jgi:hypothetical protein